MPNGPSHEYKLMKVKFYGGLHDIRDELIIYVDPLAIGHQGQGIEWSKLSAWHVRKIRRHLCPVYKKDAKAKCDCQYSWEWKHGY